MKVELAGPIYGVGGTKIHRVPAPGGRKPGGVRRPQELGTNFHYLLISLYKKFVSFCGNWPVGALKGIRT